MIKQIRILDMLGPRPGTPKQARYLLKLFIDSKVDWVLDFNGVEGLTPVFQEEFFGGLVDQFGATLFDRRLTWVHLENKSQRALHAFLQERLQAREQSR